jgi:hypothetical protein
LTWLGRIAQKGPIVNMWDVPTQRSLVHGHETNEISYGSFP